MKDDSSDHSFIHRRRGSILSAPSLSEQAEAQKQCRQSCHTESDFSRALSSNLTSTMKSNSTSTRCRYPQALPARVPATADREHQIVQQL